MKYSIISIKKEKRSFTTTSLPGAQLLKSWINGLREAPYGFKVPSPCHRRYGNKNGKPNILKFTGAKCITILFYLPQPFLTKTKNTGLIRDFLNLTPEESLLIYPGVNCFMVLKLSETIVRSNTILYCDNFEATLIFYRDILQLPVHHKNEWMVEFLLFDKTFLSIADEKRTSIKSSKGKGITISLKVENIDQAHEYFCQQGGTVSEVGPVWESKAFYVYDPEGHRVEFWT